MPLHYAETDHNEWIWGIWEISESADKLHNMLTANIYDQTLLQSITHEGKKTESMAVRVLTQQLLAYWNLPYRGIIKDSNDKPHLAEYIFPVSVSHTAKYAAVIIHRTQKVGIDIEQMKAKLHKVAPKFLSSEEQAKAADNQEKLCVYWCAKEVLYKKYGKKNLSLKDEIYIYPFDGQDQTTIYGEIIQAGYREGATIIYMKLFDYILAYSYE